ncbi:MAG TPA: divalent-cation tolerance protein CutA [Vicinamibacterales bacterium]|nr:divalent-cation tolerance protein CutA [Vicinamibacterales bacterium]
MPDAVLVLSTLPDDPSAERIARTLVDEKLAACVNLFSPMTSVYRWKGAVESGTERQIVIKTSRALVGALERRLKELHPYELPEFLVLPIDDGSSEYLRWLDESVGHR